MQRPIFSHQLQCLLHRGVGRLVIRFLTNDVVSGRIGSSYHFLLVLSALLPQAASELGSPVPRIG